MNDEGVHVPLGILLDDQKKVVDYLLNILLYLHEIIDIVEKYQSCAVTRRDLKNPDILCKF